MLPYRIGKKLQSSAWVFQTVECGKVANSFLPNLSIKRYCLLRLDIHLNMEYFLQEALRVILHFHPPKSGKIYQWQNVNSLADHENPPS